MDVGSGHTAQIEQDALWKMKQDAFFRITDQVGAVHTDEKIPPMMKNISLYLEQNPSNSYTKTKFGGIYRSLDYNLTIREYVKFDDNNWVVYIDMYNIPKFSGDSATDLNIESPFAALKKMAIGSVAGKLMLAPEGAERVITVSEDIEMKKLKVSISELKAFMSGLDEKNGYTIDSNEDQAFLVDSPSPLFADDTVGYRDGDYVGVWVSFGTLLKFDLRNLNVFNIDGTKVGAIDVDVNATEVHTLKLLSNKAYGYASMMFSKKALLQQVMDYSRKYVYETNMEDDTRICVDNLFENLQEKGIFGLLYDEYHSVENFPLMAYDETTVQVEKKLTTVVVFKYNNEYIYMSLDIPNNKMYFVTYAGSIIDHPNTEYGYNVKVMNDLWMTKANDISQEGFVLFTGFENLSANKVLDIYFDNTIESFSDLEKSFEIEVTEFDGFFQDAIFTPEQNSYDRNTDFIHVYGNNPFALATGALTYKQRKQQYGPGLEFHELIAGPVKVEKILYDLEAASEPMMSTIIDPLKEKAYLSVPSVKMSGSRTEYVSDINAAQFINDYMKIWFDTTEYDGENAESLPSVDDWVKASEAGDYAYEIVMAYYSNGWTLIKTDDDTYECVKLNPTKTLYKLSGGVEILCLAEAKTLVEVASNLLEQKTVTEVKDEMAPKIVDAIVRVLGQIDAQKKSMAGAFTKEILRKHTQVASVVDPSSARFVFNRFQGADDIFINNEPTGPILNHAIMYEDVFTKLQQQFKDVYLDQSGTDIYPTEVYSPYMSRMEVTRTDDTAKLVVTADLSNSIEVLKNATLGLKTRGDTIDKDGTITVLGQVYASKDAYIKYMELSYFGNKLIAGERLDIFRITQFTQMSEELKDAYVSKFETEALKTVAGGQSYKDTLAEVKRKAGISTGEIEFESPKVPDGTPLYIAYRDNKVMVSVDGESFTNAPLGSDGVSLSARVQIFDRVRFLSALRTMINEGVNRTEFPLRASDAHDKDDLYSVGVNEIRIDHTNFIETGYVNVVAHLFVDSGQIVLANEPDLIYSEGDSFIVEKQVDIDGFVSEGEDRFKVQVNLDVDYYVNIPTSSTTYNTAQELLVQEDAYLVKLGLPMYVSMERGDELYIDKDEASEHGVSGWIDFTKTGV